ncbi:MAG: site-specific integrase [Alphaproteobacteria bacterium]|nr:site-specific integrase [Alphaproteobacteria bacterium]
MALNFLYSYRGSADTFSAYRREMERFLQWSWFVQKKSILDHKREDIESFIEFCLKPPKSWIGLKKATRFKKLDGVSYPNPEWRPFEAHLTKKDHKDGLELNKATYQFSQPALKVMFGILSSFYNFLLQEGNVQANPIVLIRQKSKFIRKQTKTQIVRRLSNQQWETVIHLAKEQAQRDRHHERTVFILSCLYGMYLRISELVENSRWMPTMGDFFKDSENNWWFKTVGKGNKERQIAVSDAMLSALRHYRETHLRLPPTPMPNEQTPLISHLKNPHKPMTSVRPIRVLVQECFDQAASHLEKQGNHEEAVALRVATVHWLRHTGISEDVKHRPREHVRDDAGHSSSAITDRYIDIELRERAKSAKKKVIV